MNNCDVKRIDKSRLCELASGDVIWICCAGYEDRALAASREVANFIAPERLVVIKLVGGDVANETAFATALQIFGAAADRVAFEYPVFQCERVGRDLESHLAGKAFSKTSVILLDISGLPGHAICQVLYSLRHVYPANEIVCVYTAALVYHPTQEEYDSMQQTGGVGDFQKLPASLTFESSGILIPPVFSGFSVRQERSCLFLFAGFEKHRAIAAVEGVNPQKMVLVYSDPADPGLAWRLNLSKGLHQDLHAHIDRAEIVIPNTAINGALNALQKYYDMLYDQMSIVLCPMNSKLHTLACYLFWEMFQDIQLCFALPVRYLPSRSSLGVGDFFEIRLPTTQGVTLLFGLGN